jgi:hypothetical protein
MGHSLSNFNPRRIRTEHHRRNRSEIYNPNSFPGANIFSAPVNPSTRNRPEIDALDLENDLNFGNINDFEDNRTPLRIPKSHSKVTDYNKNKIHLKIVFRVLRIRTFL